MEYFRAVQEGKRRASRSQMRLFEAAGFAMLTLTTKRSGGGFEPVGEEDMAAVIRTPGGHVAILADAGGHTKAQTRAMPREEALGVLSRLTGSGVPGYGGAEVRMWTEAYPVERA